VPADVLERLIEDGGAAEAAGVGRKQEIALLQRSGRQLVGVPAKHDHHVRRQRDPEARSVLGRLPDLVAAAEEESFVEVVDMIQAARGRALTAADWPSPRSNTANTLSPGRSLSFPMPWLTASSKSARQSEASAFSYAAYMSTIASPRTSRDTS
jgi:hypothetical protein